MEDLNLGNGNMPKIDVSKAKNITCKKCGGVLFDRKYIIKEISGLAVGLGSENFMYPIDVLVCSKCGEILEDHKKELGLDSDTPIVEEKKSSLIL